MSQKYGYRNLTGYEKTAEPGARDAASEGRGLVFERSGEFRLAELQCGREAKYVRPDVTASPARRLQLSARLCDVLRRASYPAFGIRLQAMRDVKRFLERAPPLQVDCAGDSEALRSFSSN
jgi:hypothetical protein